MSAGRAQAQARVTREDLEGPGSSPMSLNCPYDLLIVQPTSRDPYRDACGAVGPAAWSLHWDTAAALARRVPASNRRREASPQAATFPPPDRPQHSPGCGGAPAAHSGTPPPSATSNQLRCRHRHRTQTVDFPPSRAWLRAFLWCLQPPAPDPRPPISTFWGHFRPEQLLSHSPCSCDCFGLPSAGRKETGPGKGASGRAAPGCCWRGRVRGGQRA